MASKVNATKAAIKEAIPQDRPSFIPPSASLGVGAAPSSMSPPSGDSSYMEWIIWPVKAFCSLLWRGASFLLPKVFLDWLCPKPKEADGSSQPKEASPRFSEAEYAEKVKQDFFCLKEVPADQLGFLTPSYCEELVQTFPNLLQDGDFYNEKIAANSDKILAIRKAFWGFPATHKTTDLCASLIRWDPIQLGAVPEDKLDFLTEQYCAKLIEFTQRIYECQARLSPPYLIKYKDGFGWFVELPDTHKTEILCAILVNQNRNMLGLMPERSLGFLTRPYCKAFFEREFPVPLHSLPRQENPLLNGWFRKLPVTHQTEILCASLVEHHPFTLKLLPVSRLSLLTLDYCNELSEKYLLIRGWFKDLPDTHKTEALCRSVVIRDLEQLKEVPLTQLSFLTEECCREIITYHKNKWIENLFRFVPETHRTFYLCNALIEHAFRCTALIFHLSLANRRTIQLVARKMMEEYPNEKALGEKWTDFQSNCRTLALRKALEERGAKLPELVSREEAEANSRSKIWEQFCQEVENAATLEEVGIGLLPGSSAHPNFEQIKKKILRAIKNLDEDNPIDKFQSLRSQLKSWGLVVIEKQPPVSCGDLWQGLNFKKESIASIGQDPQRKEVYERLIQAMDQGDLELIFERPPQNRREFLEMRGEIDKLIDSSATLETNVPLHQFQILLECCFDSLDKMGFPKELEVQ